MCTDEITVSPTYLFSVITFKGLNINLGLFAYPCVLTVSERPALTTAVTLVTLITNFSTFPIVQEDNIL